jgi:hypothetical protein
MALILLRHRNHISGSFQPERHERRKSKYMKAKEFDKIFDDGLDVTSQLDLSQAERPGLQNKRVNVDFPVWMVQMMDKESKRLGVTRQSIIKIWIAEKLKEVTG